MALNKQKMGSPCNCGIAWGLGWTSALWENGFFKNPIVIAEGQDLSWIQRQKH